METMTTAYDCGFSKTLSFIEDEHRKSRLKEYMRRITQLSRAQKK